MDTHSDCDRVNRFTTKCNSAPDTCIIIIVITCVGIDIGSHDMPHSWAIQEHQWTVTEKHFNGAL